MSHRYKRPKPHGTRVSNRGGTEARLIRYVKLIETPEQLNTVLQGVPDNMAAAFLERMKPHLKVQPHQIVPK